MADLILWIIVALAEIDTKLLLLFTCINYGDARKYCLYLEIEYI